MTDEWHGPARSGHPTDPCPECSKPCMFASDFKAMGSHRIRVCLEHGVFENGKKVNTLDVHREVTG